MPRAVHEQAEAGERRRTALVATALVAVIAVTGLLIAKWLPYGQRIATLSGTRSWTSASLLGGARPGLATGWRFLLAYGQAVWVALVAAVLIGAAVEALLPRKLLLRGPARGPVSGALFALPGMMCTCCTAPVVSAMRRRGAGLGATVSYWLGNPVLNPAVLAFLALIGPWQWTLTRIVAGAALVLGAGTLADRLPWTAPARMPAPAVAGGGRARRFARALARFAVILVPEYALVVFVVGAFGPWLFPLDAGRPDNAAVALLIALVLGVLVVIPTGGEIPVVLGLAAAGFPPLVLGALLITLPALSLPSMLMVGRALGWRTTALAAACVVPGGVAGGVLLAALTPG